MLLNQAIAQTEGAAITLCGADTIILKLARSNLMLQSVGIKNTRNGRIHSTMSAWKNFLVITLQSKNI